MIDKKRLALIIGGLVALIVIVATVTTLIVTGAQNQSQTPTPPAINTQAVEDPIKPAVLLTAEQLSTLRKVGSEIGNWSSPETDEHRQARYIAAGMSETYAKDFEPLWKGLFTNASISSMRVEDMSEPFSLEYESGATPGTGLFRAGFEITHSGQYNMGQGSPLIWPNKSFWYLILDERTGKVVGVEQPALSDLDLHPDIVKDLIGG